MIHYMSKKQKYDTLYQQRLFTFTVVRIILEQMLFTFTVVRIILEQNDEKAVLKEFHFS